MKNKTIQTKVSTGDKFIYEGKTHKVGIYKHGLINIHIPLTEFTQYTIQVSTRKLNQMLKTATLINV